MRDRRRWGSCLRSLGGGGRLIVLVAKGWLLRALSGERAGISDRRGSAEWREIAGRCLRAGCLDPRR